MHPSGLQMCVLLSITPHPTPSVSYKDISLSGLPACLCAAGDLPPWLNLF